AWRDRTLEETSGDGIHLASISPDRCTMLRKKKLSGPAALVAFLAIASAGPSFAQEAAKPDTPGTAVGPGAPTRGAEALRLFGKLEDDRSLVYIASGPPDARTQVSCSDLFRPIEV